MEENKKDVLPLEGEPLTAPQISEPVVNALAAALSKIETYVPTQYIDDGPPDIDADHLNHAEQAIMRVTNLANGAADAIAALQSQVTQLNNNMSKFDVYHRDVTGSLNDDKIIQTALEDFKTSIVTNKPILVEIQNHLGGRALAVGIQSLSNYNSFLVITYYDRPKEFVYALNHWEVYELVTKSDLGDLITHRKTTGNTSDSGNITINRPEGYSLIGAYINSVYVRLSIPTVYQKTIIVRCFDENMSPLKNTLVEVISLWIKKDISY